METVMQHLTPILQQAWTQVYPLILLAVLTYLASTVKSIVQAWKDANDNARKQKDSAWLQAKNEVFEAVLGIDEKLAKDIREKSPNGITTDEAKDLEQKAVDACKERVSQLIGGIVPCVETWIKNQIATALANTKLAKLVPPAVVPTLGVQTAEPSKKN